MNANHHNKSQVVLRVALLLCFGAPLANNAFAITSTANPPALPNGTVSDGLFPAAGGLFDATDAVFCSGSLISPRHVLTAAHCLDFDGDGTFETESGTVRFQNGPASFVNKAFDTVRTHDQWDGVSLNGNDIAVLVLDSAIDSATIAPLARFRDSDELGQAVTLVGWGRTNDGSTGIKRHGNNEIDSLTVNSTELTGDFDSDGTDVGDGSGDSGGPLLIGNSIAGVLNSVSGNEHIFPGGGRVQQHGGLFHYTRVSTFNDWIDDHIANEWNNASGGSFDTAGSWADNVVPINSDLVAFNLNSTYSVSLNADRTIDTLLIRNGNATFDMNAHTWGQTSQHGSVVVARDAADAAQVTFTDGTLNSVGGTIARDNGSQGTVSLVGVTTEWTLTDRLTIGSGGELRIMGGATLDTPEIELLGGKIISDAALTIGAGDTLTGSGEVQTSIAALVGSTITATGALTMGDAANTTGFVSDGELHVGSFEVTIHDSDGARLGTLTTLAGGKIIADNGVSVGAGETLTGNGAIEGSVNVGVGGSIVAEGALSLGVTNGSYISQGELHVGAHPVTLQVGSEAALGNLTTIEGGILNVATSTSSGIGFLKLGAGDELRGHGTVDAFVKVEAGGEIIATDTLDLGNDTTIFGFVSDGLLEVGSHTVTLHDQTVAQLGSMTSLNGGTLIAQNGFLLTDGNTLSGSGVVQGKIQAESGSTITATGALTMGDATPTTGFVSTGILEVGNHIVTLLDGDSAWLGSSTTLAGGRIIADNGVSIGAGETLTGNGTIDGWLNVGNGGQISFSGNVNGRIVVDAISSITATGDLTMGDASTNLGINSNGQLNVGTYDVTLLDMSVAKLGHVTINGGTLIAENGFLLNPIDEVSGSGTIQGDVTSSGNFSPGASPGQLLIQGDYSQLADGSLNIEIGGTTPSIEYDVLNVTGVATLGGTLEISLIDGFTPIASNAFEILFASGGVMDEFATEILPGLPENLGWSLVYGLDNVVLQVVTSTLSGDFDFDGDVDGADFLKWQRGGSPNPLSTSDLTTWETHFGTSASLSASSTAVPEPASLLLMGLTVIGMLTNSSRISRAGYSG